MFRNIVRVESHKSFFCIALWPTTPWCMEAHVCLIAECESVGWDGLLLPLVPFHIVVNSIVSFNWIDKFLLLGC